MPDERVPPIEDRELGSGGLVVPCVGMGTWKTFDVRGKLDQADRKDLVGLALDAGLRVFDSSPMYGEAERVLGAALTGRRDRAFIATKVWSQDVAEGQRQIDRALYYFDGIVDLYQVHNLVQWRTYLPVLQRMKADGTVRAVGITHYQHTAFAELERIMLHEEIDAIQVPYNALDSACAARLLPLAEERGIGVVVMRPFGEGGLTRRTPPPEALEPFRRFGVETWPQALLKWVLSDRRVTVAIPATTRPEHLLQNIAAGSPPWLGRAERDEVTRLALRYCT